MERHVDLFLAAKGLSAAQLVAQLKLAMQGQKASRTSAYLPCHLTYRSYRTFTYRTYHEGARRVLSAESAESAECMLLRRTCAPWGARLSRCAPR